MKLPALDNPSRYAGLFVVDFGETTAVGYTAAEVAILMEADAYRHAKVYKIHRALADGTMELAGMAPERLGSEDALFFSRFDASRARADFEMLKGSAEREPAPVQAKLNLARIEAADPPHVVALIYPAEFDDAMAHWLSSIDYQGGDQVEGGISALNRYYQSRRVVLEQHPLRGTFDGASRSAEEVLASTHLAVQR